MDVNVLPNDIKEYIQSLEENNQDLNSENEILREKLRLALYQKYGKSSEKISPSQLYLFDRS